MSAAVLPTLLQQTAARAASTLGASCSSSAARTGASIVGVGTDIVHVARIRQLVLRQSSRTRARRVRSGGQGHEQAHVKAALRSFSRRILTDYEAAELDAVVQSVRAVDEEDGVFQWLAVRWAAKEAAYKATFPRHRLSWKDIEVVKPSLDDGQVGVKPVLRCVAGKPMPSSILHLSIAHDADFVLAFVIAEEKEEKVIEPPAS